jgi:hypothetical protein
MLPSCHSPLCVDYVDKLRFERSTTDEEAIDVLLRSCRSQMNQMSNALCAGTDKKSIPTELSTILPVHASAVNDSCALRDLWRNLSGQIGTNFGVDLLRLCRGSDPSRADGPHRFVRDDDLTVCAQTSVFLPSCDGEDRLTPSHRRLCRPLRRRRSIVHRRLSGYLLRSVPPRSRQHRR